MAGPTTDLALSATGPLTSVRSAADELIGPAATSAAVIGTSDVADAAVRRLPVTASLCRFERFRLSPEFVNKLRSLRWNS